MVRAPTIGRLPMKQQPHLVVCSGDLRSGRTSALPLLLRDLGDDMLDLDNGAMDRELLYETAAYIELLESLITRARSAIGNCT
jgi:hypothetical protein